MPLIAVDEDTDYMDNVCPGHGGAGNYEITPVDMQDFVYINGRRVICRGEDFYAHCGNAYAGKDSECSTLVFINGVPVCREGDISLHSSECHPFYGITVKNQDFVFDHS